MDKPPVRQIKIKREKTQVTSIKIKKVNITTDPTYINGIIREFYESHCNKNLDTSGFQNEEVIDVFSQSCKT